MDYRHPIKQIANRWLAEYRDLHPDTVCLEDLNKYVNSAIAEINDSGYRVMADGTQYPIAAVSMYMANDKRVTVEYVFE